jgi:predicted deacylase
MNHFNTDSAAVLHKPTHLPTQLPAHPLAITPPNISRWAKSASGVDYVHTLDSGVAGPHTLLTALVHGNEIAGAIVLDALLASVLRPQRGCITVIFANVAAFALFNAAQPDASRYVAQDFNRVWSAALLDSSADSPELARARAIRPFVERADYLLDLHSMHEPCAPLLITGLLQRNVAFAQRLGGHGQVVIDAGHQDGTRMRDFGEFANPDGKRIALLLEAGQHWQASSVLTSQHAVLQFLMCAGNIDLQDIQRAGLHDWLQAERPAPTPLQVTQAVVASSMDFAFTGNFTGGEVFAKAGTVIAYDSGQAVTTPYDDCVLVMPSLRQLRPGVTTVRFARRL